MQILRENLHLSDSDRGKFIVRFDFAFFGSLDTPHSVACMLVFTKGTSVQARTAKTLLVTESDHSSKRQFDKKPPILDVVFVWRL